MSFVISVYFNVDTEPLMNSNITFVRGGGSAMSVAFPRNFT